MADSSNTKDMILDTAEALFSENGVDGVSLRSLTNTAGVNLAAVHYHFGSKQAVVRAVFARRMRQVNRERLAMLDSIEGQAVPQLEEVLRALLTPPLRLAAASGHGRRFMRLQARMYSDPACSLEELCKEEFREVFVRFERAFRAALPTLASEELRRRMHFVVGAMVHTMLDPASAKEWTAGASDTEETAAALVDFAAAGMRAPGAASRPALRTESA